MFLLIVEDDTLFQVLNTSYGRYYLKDNIRYPSVSTILGGGKYKKSSGSPPAAAIGSIVHYKILKRYANKILPLPTDPVWNLSREEVLGRISRCISMWDNLELNIEPIYVETTVFSEDVLFAGRMDMVCKLDGVLTLLDIKTGAQYPSNPIQISGYFHALKEEPEQSALVYLDSIIDRNPDQEGHVIIHKKPELKEYYNKFLDYYSEFQWQY